MGNLIRDTPPPGSLGYKYRGYIAYGYDIGVTRYVFVQGHSSDYGGSFALDMKDSYFDQRTTTAAQFGPMSVDCGQFGRPCPNNLVDRVTAVRMPAQPSSILGITPTNFNEGTNINILPNFYTGNAQGGGSGPGARNCYKYQDGVLQDGTGGTTATPLWPWPMDGRIKAALAYENAAGRGGTALAGVAGSGYASNTVTSEIVSKYGAIPAQCLGGAVGLAPNAPSNLIITGMLLLGLIALAARMLWANRASWL